MTCTPLIDKLLDRRLADPVRFADRVRQRPRATWSPTEPVSNTHLRAHET